MYRSILVPLDGSSFGEQAPPYALGIARRAQAELYLAHVLIAPPIPAFDAAGEADLRAQAHVYLEGLVARVQAHRDGPITTVLLDGPVAEALHDHAVAIEADLVVMTTHGHSALSRFWLGSVADKLVWQVPADPPGAPPGPHA